jgi:proline iminopeptidase
MNPFVEYVSVPGATLWTVRQGSGPALVLCHGGPGMWDYLGPIATMIEDLVTVYRYDQRGCGRSGGGPPYDVAAAVADLDALRVHWNIPQWILGGHSWGASLALAYCLIHPETSAGLLYISGTGVDPGWHAEFRENRRAALGAEDERRRDEASNRLHQSEGTALVGATRELFEAAFSVDFADKARAPALLQTLLVEGVSINSESNRVLGEDGRRFLEHPEMPAQLQRLTIPALVIHGAADLRPAWAAEKLAALLPDARIAVLPGVGHFPWLEAPEPFAEVVRSFVRSVAASDHDRSF